MLEWHPRFTNLLASKEFAPPTRMELVLQKSDKGIGGTSGSRVVVSSHWIEKHPEDIGLVVHELVHIIQGYPSPHPGWVTEGIADYLRWAIFEGKPQEWFPISAKEQGYRDSYRVTAGFFLWLESDRAPGIVRRLNAAMRAGAYEDTIFEKAAGAPLDELWKEYQASDRVVRLSASPGKKRTGRRDTSRGRLVQFLAEARTPISRRAVRRPANFCPSSMGQAGFHRPC